METPGRFFLGETRRIVPDSGPPLTQTSASASASALRPAIVFLIDYQSLPYTCSPNKKLQPAKAYRCAVGLMNIERQTKRQLKRPTNRSLLLTADIVLFAGVVGIGYLQSHHINAGFWTNYGADIIGPMWIYSTFRQLKIIRGRRPTPELAAGGIFVACFLWEWCQRFDLRGTPLGITKGSFDPFDILSYAASLFATYMIDKRVQQERTANEAAEAI